MAIVLPPPKALESGEDFEKWIGLVENYMIAINVKDPKQKKSIVLHILGSDIQNVYENLPAVDNTITDAYEIMKAKLTDYFKPKVNKVVERHIFNMMTYEGKGVPAYVAKLRTQAGKCGYPASEIDNHIRDKLVSTCPSGKVRENMLKEEELSLDRAIKIWATDLHVKEQNRIMEGDESKISEMVNKVAVSKPRFKERDSRKSCYRCGLSNHLVKDCKTPADVVCHQCKMKGHKKLACKSMNGKSGYNKDKSRSEPASKFKRNVGTIEESSSEDENYFVYKICNKMNPYCIDLGIDGQQVTFV